MQALLRVLTIAILSVTSQMLWSQAVEPSVSESELSHRLVESLQPFIDDHTVAGLVAVVADSSGILGQAVLGLSDVAASKAMQADDIFWIASMTKPITGVCVLQLVEEGKLSLSDPISKHLPEMEQLTTFDGKPVEITVKQLRTPRTGDLQTGFTPGNAWGLAVCVIREPQGVTASLSPGSYGHGGACGTQAWLDPEKDRAYILMVQRANFPNSDPSDLRRVFQDAAN